MHINWNHPSVRLTGRWDRRCTNFASTTTNGSYIEMAFAGKCIKLLFDLSTNVHPYPHLWITVDSAGRTEVPLDRIINIEAADDGKHILKVVMKSSSEGLARWFYPQEAVVRFAGADMQNVWELPQDNRPILEVVGDSITEGVLVDVDYTDQENFHDRVYQDDACATYAWICAETLNMRPRPIGFGAVGTLKSGSGEVPNVIDSYGYVYADCPCEEEKADVIVLAHGTNDYFRTDQEFSPAYTTFLQVVRGINPSARICAMSPFCGRFEDVLPTIVDNYNKTNNDNVIFISTKGWLPPEPVHPLKPAHAQAGKLLAQALADKGVVSR